MKAQWKHYKELELLPEDAVEPQAIYSPIVAYLDRCWRSILNHRANKLDYEYQVEYLEQRLKLNCDQLLAKRSGFGKLWHFLNQPLSLISFPQAEPEIRQTQDQAGQTWWRVYDPLTGQTAYLESEAEVHIWLEERLYH